MRRTLSRAEPLTSVFERIVNDGDRDVVDRHESEHVTLDDLQESPTQQPAQIEDKEPRDSMPGLIPDPDEQEPVENRPVNVFPLVAARLQEFKKFDKEAWLSLVGHFYIVGNT